MVNNYINIIILIFSGMSFLFILLFAFYKIKNKEKTEEKIKKSEEEIQRKIQQEQENIIEFLENKKLPIYFYFFDPPKLPQCIYEFPKKDYIILFNFLNQKTDLHKFLSFLNSFDVLLNQEQISEKSILFHIYCSSFQGISNCKTDFLLSAKNPFIPEKIDLNTNDIENFFNSL